VKITATTTGKVPNTSPTAASSGSDLNGMAARNAVATIKARLVAFLAERHQAEKSDVVFLPNRIRIKEHEISFDQAVNEAYRGRIHLSAAGFYATPKIHWDRAAAKGRPFFYFRLRRCGVGGGNRHVDGGEAASCAPTSSTTPASRSIRRSDLGQIRGRFRAGRLDG
jgi:xanthine dehydrogenase molybdopterin-binding subunit B